jgi:hypothetical protein
MKLPVEWPTRKQVRTALDEVLRDDTLADGWRSVLVRLRGVLSRNGLLGVAVLATEVKEAERERDYDEHDGGDPVSGPRELRGKAVGDS